MHALLDGTSYWISHASLKRSMIQLNRNPSEIDVYSLFYMSSKKKKNEIIWSGGSTLALKFSYNHSMSKSRKIPIQGNEKSFKSAKSSIVADW